MLPLSRRTDETIVIGHSNDIEYHVNAVRDGYINATLTMPRDMRVDTRLITGRVSPLPSGSSAQKSLRFDHRRNESIFLSHPEGVIEIKVLEADPNAPKGAWIGTNAPRSVPVNRKSVWYKKFRGQGTPHGGPILAQAPEPTISNIAAPTVVNYEEILVSRSFDHPATKGVPLPQTAPTPITERTYPPKKHFRYFLGNLSSTVRRCLSTSLVRRRHNSRCA